MQTVTLKDLKLRLSYILNSTKNGTPFEITKYNKPIAFLVPPQDSRLHFGKMVRKETLKKILKKSTKGVYLKFLIEDRNDE